MADKKSVLVVGASRGLGLALAEAFAKRGFEVTATTRGASKELQTLSAEHADAIRIETGVDIAKLESVRALHQRLEGRGFDVLFVNAGVCKANELTPLEVNEQDFIDMQVTNALSPMRVIQLFEDLVPRDGVIAVMSSELGSVTNSTGKWELYSSSKAALNMLMKSYSAHRPEDTRALLLIAPGWVKTDMGTAEAILEVEDSIPLVTDLVIRSAGAPGLRYVDRFGEIIPW